MFARRRTFLHATAAWLALCATAHAQAPNEFDFDATQLAVTTIPPNAATHTIATSITYTGQNLELHAPLTVRAGAELRLERSILKVFGQIVMEEGSRVTVIDSSLLIPCQFQRQYELVNEGGLLHTERAVIGSTYNGATLYQTGMLNHRGTWLARDTVMQSLFTLCGDGRVGWAGNPRFRGGSVFADGLHEGEGADAVHAGGVGDISLANGSANVGFHYDAGSSGPPVFATMNLDPRSPQNVVYGDPTVHSGVTAPIARHPCRIELRNHRSNNWQFFAVGVTPTGTLHTITLQNAAEIICNVRAVDLVGSPVLGGPWATHYSELPGLPSTTRPGHHAMPPGCSVRLGNVVFQSGPAATDWNRIGFWGLYLTGTQTNVTVTGPTAFAELHLRDGQMQLTGTRSFDMGIGCNALRLFGSGNLQLTNVALGNFTTGANNVALIEANESSTCTIQGARVAPLRWKTTSGAASIVGQNVYGAANLIFDNSGGGVIQVLAATPTQNWDLQNLDFEAALIGGVPSYWSGTSTTGTLVPDPAPGPGGVSSYQLVAQAPNASLSKQLSLPTETSVTLIGLAKVVQAPSGGGQLLLRSSNGPAVSSKALDLLQPNVWQRVHVPLLTIGAAASPTPLQFTASGLPATVRLDAFRVHVGSWWDNDNLANLDFEGAYRFQGQGPTSWSTPDAWRSFLIRCAEDSGNVRPGAAPGSKSMRMTLESGTNGNLWKDLTFLRAGDTVVIRGWSRGVSANAGSGAVLIVGDGSTAFVVGLGNNQVSPLMPFDGIWRQFQVTYLVPANPTFTRIYCAMADVPGTQCWYDDLTVEIR